MPAVMIRQLDSLAKIMADTSSAAQRRVLLDQAAMILRASERSVPEKADRDDVRRRYEEVLAAEAVSALDWPELAVRAVIPQPDERPLILLRVAWPARPQLEATLLIALASEDHRSLPLLSQWCMTGASVSPARPEGAGLELRRRQSLERVHAVLIAEDAAPGLRQGRERRG
jgi:hypothetical protein